MNMGKTYAWSDGDDGSVLPIPFSTERAFLEADGARLWLELFLLGRGGGT